MRRGQGQSGLEKMALQDTVRVCAAGSPHNNKNMCPLLKAGDACNTLLEAGQVQLYAQDLLCSKGMRQRTVRLSADTGIKAHLFVQGFLFTCDGNHCGGEATRCHRPRKSCMQVKIRA